MLLMQIGLFQEMEWKFFDLKNKIYSESSEPPDDIAIILIDEASLSMMNPVVGRWPWPRSIHSEVIDYLVSGGARRVVFDVLFTEHEKGAPATGLGDDDLQLVESTMGSGNVVMAAQLLRDTEDEYNHQLLNRPLPGSFTERFSLQVPPYFYTKADANNYYLPFQELQEASSQIGIVEFSPDSDGVYRRTRLFREYQESYFPVLAIAALPDKSQQSLLNSSLRIPLEDEHYLIKMYKGFEPFSMSGVLASIQMIYNGEIENLPVYPDEFSGKTVFIGASAVGVEDLKLTPLSTVTPGVYLHASIYGNIQKGDFLRQSNTVFNGIFYFILSLLCAFSVMLPTSLRNRILFSSVLSVGMLFGTTHAFSFNLVVPTFTPLMILSITILLSYSYLSATEGREKRRIKHMLGQYVSPAMLDSVLSSSDGVMKAEIGSRERLSILFSDIRGFTSLSEQLPAEDVVDVLNNYFSGMVDIIFTNEGTLDKFIGDAIMAFWGAPIMIENHAQKAVSSATQMIRWLDEYNKDLAERDLPTLAIGVGIHTGEVILGNIGSEKKLDYTVIGDNVNLSSRMEGLTKPYGAAILISNETMQDLGDFAICRVVDQVRVKGKQLPTSIYEVLTLNSDNAEIVSEAEKKKNLTETAFGLYLKGAWDDATSAYSKLHAEFPDDLLASIFLERCTIYREKPPESWDGVFTLTTK